MFQAVTNSMFPPGKFPYPSTSNGSKFIRVDKFEEAVKQDVIKCEWFSSLITDDHKIQIGDQLFWDWEDDCLVG